MRLFRREHAYSHAFKHVFVISSVCAIYGDIYKSIRLSTFIILSRYFLVVTWIPIPLPVAKVTWFLIFSLPCNGSG